MKHEQFTYTTTTGWSVSPFPALDSEKTLVLAFGASEFLSNPEPISQLVRAFPKAHVLGCSTAGEILGSTLSDHSLVVMVMQFEHTRVVTATAKVQKPQESFSAGRKLGAILGGPTLSGVLVLSDGSVVNGTELVQGFNLPANVIITGGLAGDGPRFERTWVIADGKPQTNMVTAVGFYGHDISIGFGSQGGWQITGTEWTVTRAQDNILFELNGQPALTLYKQVIGDRARDLPSSALLFPLALRANAADDKPIVRTILSVDEAHQSMMFAGDVPQGFLAQLMHANLDHLISSASKAAAMAHRDEAKSSDTVCIAISCVGRRLVLADRAHEELQATLKALPANTQQIGFYSYGEISPSGGYCDLHNQTMTITTLEEK